MTNYVYGRYFGNYTLVRNSDIKQAKANWQRALNALNYTCGKPDGIFGSNTERQTKNFQRDHQLTVDGKAGNKTKMAMFNLFFDANGRSTLGNYCSYLNDSQMAGTDEGYNPDQQ